MAVIGTRSRREAIDQLVRYIHSDKGRLDHDDRLPPIYWNMHAASPEEAMCSFQENESRRRVKRRNSIVVYHDHFSIHPLDKPHVTPEILDDLAYKYIELRSGNQAIPIFARAHLDGKNPHVHFAIAGVDIAGNSTRLSNQRFLAIRRKFETYQKARYPELKHSIVYDKEKFKMLDKQASDQARRAQNAFRNAKAGRKQEKKIHCHQMVTAAYSQARSFPEFQAKLACSGIDLYRRSGKLTGIVYRKQKFRFSTLRLPPEILHGIQVYQQIDTKTQQLTPSDHKRPGLERG